MLLIKAASAGTFPPGGGTVSPHYGLQTLKQRVTASGENDASLPCFGDTALSAPHFPPLHILSCNYFLIIALRPSIGPDPVTLQSYTMSQIIWGGVYYLEGYVVLFNECTKWPFSFQTESGTESVSKSSIGFLRHSACPVLLCGVPPCTCGPLGVSSFCCWQVVLYLHASFCEGTKKIPGETLFSVRSMEM